MVETKKATYGYRGWLCLLGWGLWIWLTACHSAPVTRTIIVKTPEPDTLTATVLRKYAQRLEVPVDSLVNPDLYRFVDRRLASSVDSAAVDNAAFAQQLYRQVYEHRLKETAAEQFSSPETYLFKGQAYLQEGDLLFFRLPGATAVNYVGVYLKNRYFVHASPNPAEGVQISALTDGEWNSLFVAAGRVKRL